MSALITNQKSPRVIRVRGKVRIFNSTPIVALMKPIASAAMRAATGPLTEIPGTTCATIHTASALRTQFSSSRIFASLGGMTQLRPLRELYQELALEVIPEDRKAVSPFLAPLRGFFIFWSSTHGLGRCSRRRSHGFRGGREVTLV